MDKNSIVTFSEYLDGDENIDEGIIDSLTGILGSLGGGLVRTAKQKIIAYLLSYLKVKEKSPISKLIQEIFEEIPISYYYGFITGDSKSWREFTPKIASGFVEFIQRTGLDEIAESIGIESDGYLYNIIRESFSDKLSKKENFTKEVEDFLNSIFTGKMTASDGIDVDKVVKSMSSEQKKSILKNIDNKNFKTENRSDNRTITEYLDSLLKDKTNSFAKSLTK